MPQLLLGTMRVAPRSHRILREKSTAGSALYFGTLSAGLSKFDDQRRRLVVRKFPFSIIYELHGNDVVILAVAHGKRRPNYWRERSADE